MQPHRVATPGPTAWTPPARDTSAGLARQPSLRVTVAGPAPAQVGKPAWPFMVAADSAIHTGRHAGVACAA